MDGCFLHLGNTALRDAIITLDNQDLAVRNHGLFSL